MDETYTVGTWHVRAGDEDAFVRSVDDLTRFVSFGSWPSREAVQVMRAHSETPARLGQLIALCEEARPGTYRVVATAP